MLQRVLLFVAFLTSMLALTPGSSAGQRVVGQWTLQPERPAPELRFGWSVAVAGETVVVGAPGDTTNGSKAGAVYVFERTGGRKLVPPDGAPDARFGWKVAIENGRIAAGAPYDRTVYGDGAGSLVVFEETPDGWTSETLVPAQGSPDAWFGLTVTAASVFGRTVEGRWQEQPLAPIVEPARKDHFGRAVVVRGPRVFVGAEEDDNANGTNAGGVFAVRLGRPEAPPELIIPPDGAPRSYLGFALATTEQYLAASESAEVRLFALLGEEATEGAKLSTLMGAALPGGVLALGGDGQRLAVGMPLADGARPNAGAVVVVDVAP